MVSIRPFGCCCGTRDPKKRILRRLAAGNPLAKLLETKKEEEKMKTKSNNGKRKNFVPWCGVLLILLLTSAPVFGSMGSAYRYVSLPELENYEFVEQRGEFPTIVIDKNGKAWLDGSELDDGPKAVIMIEDRIELLKCYKKKVFLKADESVQFGRIAKVLEILSEAGIKVVTFITDEYAAPIDFFKDFKRNRTLI